MRDGVGFWIGWGWCIRCDDRWFATDRSGLAGESSYDGVRAGETAGLVDARRGTEGKLERLVVVNLEEDFAAVLLGVEAATNVVLEEDDTCGVGVASDAFDGT